MKRLNNLVTQLSDVVSTDGSSKLQVEFDNPRDGWVFFAVASTVGNTGSISLILDGEQLQESCVTEATHEAMRHIVSGIHTVVVEAEDDATITGVEVRAIPELIYCQYPGQPLIPEYGVYDWDFLHKNVFAHVNTIVGSGALDYEQEMTEWKARGGRWITGASLHGISADTTTAEEVFDTWSNNPAVSNELLDGIIIDEFHELDTPRYDAWTAATKKFFAEQSDLLFYPYVGSHTMSAKKPSDEFVRTVFERGGVIVWERYIDTYHTEELGALRVEERYANDMRDWHEAYPGCAANMIACMGYLTITETVNIHPSVDYKVYMDTQFQHLATVEEFEGLYGLMEYHCGYADEETVRWAARLYRHYGIEGNTDLLSKQYGWRYSPNIIHNPDFAAGIEGWTVHTDDWSEISGRSHDFYGHLQGRMPPSNVGDTFLWTKRGAEQPKGVSQTLRNLIPGQLYSAKLITGNYDDLIAGRSIKKEHAVCFEIDGVDMVPEKSFLAVVANNYAHKLGPFTADYSYWFNHHRYVFRATEAAAQLSISNWKSADERGGPVGEELIFNFVEVQPYYQEQE